MLLLVVVNRCGDLLAQHRDMFAGQPAHGLTAHHLGCQGHRCCLFCCFLRRRGFWCGLGVRGGCHPRIMPTSPCLAHVTRLLVSVLRLRLYGSLSAGPASAGSLRRNSSQRAGLAEAGIQRSRRLLVSVAGAGVWWGIAGRASGSGPDLSSGNVGATGWSQYLKTQTRRPRRPGVKRALTCWLTHRQVGFCSHLTGIPSVSGPPSSAAIASSRVRRTCSSGVSFATLSDCMHGLCGDGQIGVNIIIPVGPGFGRASAPCVAAWARARRCPAARWHITACQPA